MCGVQGIDVICGIGFQSGDHRAAMIGIMSLVQGHLADRGPFRGGVEYEDNHPTTVLDGWLRAVAEDPKPGASAT